MKQSFRAYAIGLWPRYAIANLINPCEAVDQLDEGMLLPLLPQECQHPSLDRD
ncbi:hypothetical protein [Moorena producens]|uniref:hypothetical protein n=1 Tax=Moorena producens TaxID=1155739 RepID=UPI003C722CE5